MAKKPVDFRSFKGRPRGAPPSKPELDESDSKEDGYWWKDESDVHSRLFDVIRKLNASQSQRMDANFKHLRMYGDKDAFAFGSPSARWNAKGLAPTAIARERITFNVARMGVDTLGAKIAKNKPRVVFETDGGNYAQRKRAKGLEKFVAGVFHEVKLARKSRLVFKDGAIQDIGILKWWREGSEIKTERVLPTELYVDEADGVYGEPRQIHQVKAVPREILLDAYPECRMDILQAEGPLNPKTNAPFEASQTLSDYVEVVESWHLRSGKNAKDGRHVIAISNKVLLDEKEWKGDRFPFAFFRFSSRLQGFFGMGVVEQLLPIQTGLNRTLKAISAMLHLMSVPRYYVEETSGIVTAHLNNEIGAIIKYRGNPPQLVSQNVVPPELFEEVERWKARAFELIGVSQLSASSLKPAGLNSGAAQREFLDNESERFSDVVDAFDEFFLDCAEQVIDLAEEIAADSSCNKEFQATYTAKGSIEKIAWKDVNLDRDAFVMKMFPTSSLPQTPTGRKAAIADMQQAGWIDSTEARRLLDMPDLDNSNNLAFAAQEDVEHQAQQLLDGGEYEPPEPHQDLSYGMKHFQSQYLRAKRMDAPRAVLDNLLAWMGQAEDFLNQAAQAGSPATPAPAPGAPPGQVGPGGPPPGMPPPMPQAA